MITIPEIKFRNATHVAEVIEETLAGTPANLKPIVAAVLSLWKWEQNKRVKREEGSGTPGWSLRSNNNMCGLCRVYWKGSEGECGDCSLAKFGGDCYKASSPYGRMKKETVKNKRPLIAALEQTVLYEFAQEFARRCGETVEKEVGE